MYTVNKQQEPQIDVESKNAYCNNSPKTVMSNNKR